MAHTKTAPEDRLPPALQGPDPVTAVRVYGCPGEHPLPLTQDVFTVGSSSTCDVRVAGEYISQKHCLLLRHEQRLRVKELDDHNGIFFRGHRETSFDIHPGDTFHLATTQLLALNDPMRLVRPVLTEVLGRDQEATVDHVVVTSALDRPILIIGPRGAGQSDLVRAIHDMSVRRNQLLIQASEPPTTREEEQQLIDGGQRGTLALSVNGDAVDETFLDTVLAPKHGARLILLAPSLKIASRSVNLGRLMPMSHIHIRPLCERPNEIPYLLELQFVRNGASIRLDHMSPENRDSLLEYDWPENLAELRQAGAMIAALELQNSGRKAADAIQMPRSTMQYRLKRIGLIFRRRARSASPPLECPAT